jgi:hypothetical protein
VDGVPHGTDETHQSEFGHSLQAHDGDQSDTELDGEHCEHCCHGHSAGLNTVVAALTMPYTRSNQRIASPSHIRNLAQAPPTPPPNA